jgi:hypothetical protein
MGFMAQEINRLNSSKQQPVKQKASALKAQRPARLCSFNLAVICLAITGSNMAPVFSETLQGKVTTVEVAPPLRRKCGGPKRLSLAFGKSRFQKSGENPQLQSQASASNKYKAPIKVYWERFRLWGNYQAENWRSQALCRFLPFKIGANDS